MKEVGLVQKFNDSILGPLKLIGIIKIETLNTCKKQTEQRKKIKRPKPCILL